MLCAWKSELSVVSCQCQNFELLFDYISSGVAGRLAAGNHAIAAPTLIALCVRRASPKLQVDHWSAAHFLTRASARKIVHVVWIHENCDCAIFALLEGNRCTFLG